MLGAGGLGCFKIRSGGKDNGNVIRPFAAQVGSANAVLRSTLLNITGRCCF